MNVRAHFIAAGAMVAIGGALLVGCGSSGSDATTTVIQTVTAAGGTTSASDATPVKVDAITQELQKDLTALGFYKGAATGQYDAATKTAVQAFQRSVGLAVDGIAGPQTQAAIDIKRGRRTSGAVSMMQRVLTATCHYSGAINGVYTSATEAAVLEFQKEQGLTEDGQFGPQTANAMVTAYQNRPSSCAGRLPTPAATETGSTPPTATVTVKGPQYAKTFEVTSCKSTGETGVSLTGGASGGFTVSLTATNGKGKLAISGGNESDGVNLSGDVSQLQVGDAGDIRGSGTFTTQGAFTVVGRCA